MDPDMERQRKIGFIGAGNMAFGIAKGILSGESRHNCWETQRRCFRGDVHLLCAPSFRKCSSRKRPSERAVLQEPGTLSGNVNFNVALLETLYARFWIGLKVTFLPRLSGAGDLHHSFQRGGGVWLRRGFRRSQTSLGCRRPQWDFTSRFWAEHHCVCGSRSDNGNAGGGECGPLMSNNAMI